MDTLPIKVELWCWQEEYCSQVLVWPFSQQFRKQLLVPQFSKDHDTAGKADVMVSGCAFRFLLYHLLIFVIMVKSLILPDLQDAHP